MTNKNLGYYCQKFSQLRVDRSHGSIAPHKPILLLSVIDLVEQGMMRHNRIFLSAEIIATFLKFWGQLGSDAHRSNIALPFFHLKRDGFWHLKTNPGYEKVIASGQRAGTVNTLRQVINYAYLDDELFALLLIPNSRHSLVSSLINTWFNGEQGQIESLLNINALQLEAEDLRQSGGAVYQPEELKDEAKTVVRDAAFRRVIVSIYEYRCAFCGLQVIDGLGQNIVDGAHIKPFATFFDNRIKNGISLCKSHHWAFDCGWFSICDDYSIVVSEDLREDSPRAKPMRQFQGCRIRLPVYQQYYPCTESLYWHRENVFIKT